MVRHGLAGLVLALAGLVHAQGVRVDARAVGPMLVVNEADVHKVEAARGGKSPSARAADMAATVSAWDGQASPSAVAEGKAWFVRLGARTVLTVTPEDAKAARSQPEALAKSVARKLGSALAAGKLKTTLADADTPPDRPVEFALLGSEARKAGVQIVPPGVVRAERAQGVLRLVPVGKGTASVRITGASTAAAATVRVLPYAPAPAASVNAVVSGRVATAEAVEQAALAAVMRGFVGQPAVRATVVRSELGAIAAGMQAAGRLRLKLEAPDSFAREAVVAVSVRNEHANLSNETALLYSNDPEDVQRPETLYGYRFEPRRPVRLLWHHKNTTWFPMVLEYLLVNGSESPVPVRLTMGEGLPHTNPTLSGYQAGTAFFQAWRGGQAVAAVVPPGSALPLVAARFASNETVSGLGRIEAHGPGLRIVARAVRADNFHPGWRAVGAGTGSWYRMAPVPLAELGKLEDLEPRHVYPRPFREEAFEYVTGGRFGFVRVGERAIPDESGTGVLHGNFGVLYRVTGQLSNPTSAPAEVEVVLEASAGYTGMFFEWGGEFVKGGLFQPKAEFLLSNVKMPPGSVQTVTFQTMPLSGANYPVTFIIRPVGIEK